jgi:hypothetical protein
MPTNGIETAYKDRYTFAPPSKRQIKAGSVVHFASAIYTVRAEAFCQRFRSELGYTYAHAWPIYERGSTGKAMYHMIHCSDHEEAPKLMSRAYRTATRAPEPATQLELEFASAFNEAKQE